MPKLIIKFNAMKKAINNLKARYLSNYRDYWTTLRNFGLKGLSIDIKNRRKIWSIKSLIKLDKSRNESRTSISDVPEYVQICKMASESEIILNSFKSCYEYRLVLEHVTRYQGLQYLNFIVNDFTIVEMMKRISSKEIGNPLKYPFPFIGDISPTQIRYAKIVRDIKFLFQNLDFNDVIEVGIGNGTLSAQISDYFKVDSYTLVDLPSVINLAKKVLKPYYVQTEYKFINSGESVDKRFDLFISNYAFSELGKESQNFYLEHFIRKSKSGYMLYNHIHENADFSYTAIQMLEKIPNSKLFKESPKTYDGNVVLCWGISKNTRFEEFEEICNSSSR